MDDDDRILEPIEKYQVLILMRKDDPPASSYEIQHWFSELPGRELVARLLDEAQHAFAGLYSGAEPSDQRVFVTRLRPADDFRPDFARLLG